MASKIALRFPLTGLHSLCRTIKYSLTVNSVLVAADTDVVVTKPIDNVLRIASYNSGVEFEDADVISISIKQGIAWSTTPITAEITYSSGTTVGFTISYTVPSQPSAPTVSAHVSALFDQFYLNLSASFTIHDIDTTATKLYYYYTVVPAAGEHAGQTLTFNPYAVGDGRVISAGGADQVILIDRLDPSEDLSPGNTLHIGDVVTLRAASGVPLGDNTWYFSTNVVQAHTLNIPVTGITPAAPGATGAPYGVIT